MDNFHSFPLQQDDDNDHDQFHYLPTNFTNSSFLNYHQEYTTPQLQDLDVDLAPFDSFLEVNTNINFDSNKTNNITNKKGKKLQKSSSAVSLQVENTTADDKQKKIIHKEIERQRRQEMSSLYASLRQLLPLEYLKGKRSTSDHILEAVNYIEHLQKKIKHLEDNRDKLKKDFSSSNVVDYPKSGCSSISESSRTIVSVRPCLEGMEILINWNLTNEGFCLSRVLEVLHQEGLSIVNCSCNKVNGSLVHSIRTEVGSQASIDAYELQQKLEAMD